MSTTGVTLSQSSAHSASRTGSRASATPAEQSALSQSRTASRVSQAVEEPALSGSGSRNASRASQQSVAADQPALSSTSNGSRANSRVSEQQASSRPASQATANLEQPALSGSRTASRVSQTGTPLSAEQPSSRTASQVSQLASQAPALSGSRVSSRVSNNSGVPAAPQDLPALSGSSRLSQNAVEQQQPGSRTASRVSQGGVSSVLPQTLSASGSRTASRVSQNEQQPAQSLNSSRTASRLSATEQPAQSSSGSRSASRSSTSAPTLISNIASTELPAFSSASQSIPAFSSFSQATPLDTAQSVSSRHSSRAPSKVVESTPVSAEPATPASSPVARKSFEARSRFNHRIKSRNLANPDSDFTVDLNIDKVLNPNCPESPKFNNAVIKKEANKYTLDINLSNYDPETINVEPTGDRIVVTAKYETPLSEKKTEFGELNHSYRLPNAEINTLTSNLRQDGHLEIEIPFNLATGVSGASANRYPVVSEDGKTVTYTYELPTRVNPGNLEISYDGRKVILRANDAYLKDKTNSASSFAGNGSFCFFHSVTFPVKTDFSSLVHQIEGNVLTLSANLNQLPSQASSRTASHHSNAAASVLADAVLSNSQPQGSRTASRISQSGTPLSAEQPAGSRTASRVSQATEQPALSGSRTASRVSQTGTPLSAEQPSSRTASRVSQVTASFLTSEQPALSGSGSRAASRVSQTHTEQPALSGSGSRTTSRLSQAASSSAPVTEQPALSANGSRTASRVSQHSDQPVLSASVDYKVTNSEQSSRTASRNSQVSTEPSRISNLEAADQA